MSSAVFWLRYATVSPPVVDTVFRPQSTSANSGDGVRLACFLTDDEKLMPNISTLRTMFSASFATSPYSLNCASVLNMVMGGRRELAKLARYETVNGNTFLILLRRFLASVAGDEENK